MTEIKMDPVDTQQQNEIEAIKEKNKDQDFWIKLLAIGIVGWLMLATTIMMIRMTQWMPPKQQTQEK